QLQLLVENFEALLRNVIGHDVVDGDLQMIQTRAVEALNAVGRQQISVGDHAGNDAVPPYARDHLVELGMEHRLPAGDGDDGRAQLSQAIDAAKHGFERHRLGVVVVFVAVGAGQVASPHGNNVHIHGVIGRDQSFSDHANFAGAQVNLFPRPA